MTPKPIERSKLFVELKVLITRQHNNLIALKDLDNII